MPRIGPLHFTSKNGKPILFRSYVSGDEEQALEFARQVARESTHTLKYEGMPDAPKDKLGAIWAEYDKHPVNLHLGAFCDGKAVGNLRFFQKRPDHPWVKHIGAFGMAVLQDYWGEGIGSKMLEILDAHVRSCGITRIEAEVRVANERGVALYKKAGYKIEGTREKAALINGQYLDEYYIAKLLK